MTHTITLNKAAYFCSPRDFYMILRVCFPIILYAHPPYHFESIRGGDRGSWATKNPGGKWTCDLGDY